MKESCNVLHDNPSRSKLANDSEHLGPKTRALIGEPESEPSPTDALAREATDDDVCAWQVASSDGADVIESRDVRPVPLENAEAEGVLLDLGDDTEPSGALKAAAEPFDAGEEADDI